MGEFSPLPYQNPRSFLHDDSVFSADFSVVSVVVAKVVVGLVAVVFSAWVAVFTALRLLSDLLLGEEDLAYSEPSSAPPSTLH